MSFKLIQTITLSQNAAGIVFTNIPQDGTDLMVIASLQADVAGTALQDIGFRFNNTTTNQTSTRLELGTTTVAASNRTTEVRGNNEIPTSGAVTPTHGNAIIYIMDYANTTAHKVIDFFSGGETNDPVAHINVLAGRWASNSALTQLSVQRDVGATNLAAGSSASLYKITKP